LNNIGSGWTIDYNFPQAASILFAIYMKILMGVKFDVVRECE